ncbi:MAG: hypothetical protein IPL26_24075 [Leptospiraceae bacterium]|nr:hypothetical protein [Leptospiraceae bacterium]
MLILFHSARGKKELGTIKELSQTVPILKCIEKKFILRIQICKVQQKQLCIQKCSLQFTVYCKLSIIMKNKILQLLLEKGEANPREIADYTGFSRQYVHKKLSQLLDSKEVIKIGTPPLVFYQINSNRRVEETEVIGENDKSFLKEHFIEITEDGSLLEGLEAFAYWCQKRKLPLEKTIQEYRQTLLKYKAFRNEHDFINGIEKIKSTKGMDVIHLDGLYYLDFYAIERFGKTLMGQLLHFAKQGQNKKLSLRLIQMSALKIHKLIEILKIDAVGFIPPTIRRDVQFMHLLEKNLNIKIAQIKILKVKGEIIVPQKALSKMEDRILNARQSLFPKETRSFNKVLLIDDAVGSGATLNETANKLKLKGIGKEIYGLAITGSFKGFEVISEA